MKFSKHTKVVSFSPSKPKPVRVDKTPLWLVTGKLSQGTEVQLTVSGRNIMEAGIKADQHIMSASQAGSPASTFTCESIAQLT